MNDLPKYVVSDHLARTQWPNSHVASRNLAAEIEQLKRQPGKDIALFAGAGVAASFARLDLIDEYRIILNPALLGAGTPLFNGGYEKTNLQLRETRQFGAGALVLTYQRDETA